MKYHPCVMVAETGSARGKRVVHARRTWNLSATVCGKQPKFRLADGAEHATITCARCSERVARAIMVEGTAADPQRRIKLQTWGERLRRVIRDRERHGARIPKSAVVGDTETKMLPFDAAILEEIQKVIGPGPAAVLAGFMQVVSQIPNAKESTDQKD